MNTPLGERGSPETGGRGSPDPPLTSERVESPRSFMNHRPTIKSELRPLLTIALPLVVSQAADSVMMFVDRLFLARLGPEYMPAAMSGGLTTFLCMTFFVGLITFGNAMVAQNFGAERRDQCAKVTTQALLLALIAYPVVLAMIPVGRSLCGLAGADNAQVPLARQYYTILTAATLLIFLRMGFDDFFAGTSKTAVIMVANLTAMFVNIGANYVLIFGKFGFPALGIRGAAFGTALGAFVSVGIVAARYFSPGNRRDYFTPGMWKPDRKILGTLIRYGTPAGVEFMLNVAAFHFVVHMMHSYGPETAASVTIAFSWDLMAFIPLIGLRIATMSLVGQRVGAKDIPGAYRATYASIFTAVAYTGTLAVLFLTIPEVLAGVFADPTAVESYRRVLPDAANMLMIASVYLLSDASFLVFGGALRGAGDTAWAMRASVLVHWIMAGIVFLLVKVVEAPPLVTWAAFSIMVTGLGLLFLLRFRSGRWESFQLLAPETPIPPVQVRPDSGAEPPDLTL